MTLAERLKIDGLLVFSSALPIAKQNAFLDDVRSFPGKRPATGHWGPSYMTIGDMFDLSHDWMSFKYAVESQTRYAVEFGKRGIPDLPRLLNSGLPGFRGKVKAGTTFYRARRFDSSMQGRTPRDDEIDAPPTNHASAGRANATGIRVLYVATDETTAVAEVRPFVGAMVAVGTCVPIDDLLIFDMTSMSHIRGLDPFAPQFKQNIDDAKIIASINEEFARPLALYAPEREYAPTQFVAEIIRQARYDGIRYLP